jgi:dTMP kinase
MNEQGKLITLEGSEGCGKSTQIGKLVAWLQEKSLKVFQVREPGGTMLGEEIRHLLKHHPAGHGMCPEAELLLFTSSRAQLMRQCILPVLAQGHWVVCDRFLDSTTVYQGYARGLDLETVRMINRFAVGGRMPDLTLVLDVPHEEAMKRVQRRPRPVGVSDRMEAEPPEFYQTVREGYRQLAQQEPERVRWVEASGDSSSVFQALQKELRRAFPQLMD